MDFKRIFANALARRIAYVIVAALLAALGFSSKAKAEQFTFATQGQAYAKCVSDGTSIFPQVIMPGTTREYAGCLQGGNAYELRYKICEGAVCGAHAPTGWVYVWSTSCSSNGSQVTGRLPLAGSLQCINGCMYTYMLNGDDETSTRSPNGNACNNTKDNCPAGTFYNVLMNVCQPLAPECKPGERLVEGVCEREADCPEGMVAVQATTPGAIASGELFCKPKAPECPPGNIKSPAGVCLPGEGQCAAGEAKKKDGTCGKDANNDGVADDDDADPENDTDKESFSGGDSCSAPPACDGSPIMCGQARIQWRIECNTRKNRNVTGGSCGAVPICTGEKCDAVEYASLVMQWRTACALEKGTEGGGESGDNSDVIDHLKAQTLAERNALQALGTSDGLVGDEESKIWADEGQGQLPSTGLLGGGGATCSLSITIRGKVIGMSPQGYQILAFIHWLLVAAAYIWVAVQLGK